MRTAYRPSYGTSIIFLSLAVMLLMVLVTATFLIGIGVRYAECESATSILQVEMQFDVLTGCKVKTEGGLVPLNKYRISNP